MGCLLNAEGLHRPDGGAHRLPVLFSARMALDTHSTHVIPETVLAHLDPALGDSCESPGRPYHVWSHGLNQGTRGHVANSIKKSLSPPSWSLNINNPSTGGESSASERHYGMQF